MFLNIFAVFLTITAVNSVILPELSKFHDENIEKNIIHEEILDSRNLTKRFTNIFNPPNKVYQKCITPAGTNGHCKHIQHCILSEFKNYFWNVFDYLCIIEKVAVGVCCPDELNGGQGQLPGGSSLQSGDAEVPENDSGRVARSEERGCGIATKQYPRITGGRPADPNEWPWMAAILLRGHPKAYCGGTLITDRHVLTAAHCVYRDIPNDVFVRLGEYDFKAFNETRSRDFRVADIKIHVDFDTITYSNDLSVIKLDRPTIFTTYIWPVCMPPLDEDWSGWTGIVIGWGSQFYNGPFSDVLMEVSMPIWKQDRCQESYIERIDENFICAGSEEGGRDSCQGDSGGPLMVQIPNKRWVVVGVVSYGYKCGLKDHPGMYTRVSKHLSWIIENSNF